MRPRGAARAPAILRAPVLACAVLLVSAAPATPPPEAPAAPCIRFVRELPGDSARHDVAAHVLPLADGALITGWTSRPGAPADGFVIRVDAEAGVRWRREFGGAQADLLFAAETDGAGGFVLAGFTASRGAGSTDGWIVRVDSSGTTTWERTYGGAEQDRLTSLQRTARGWMAGGQTSRGGDVDAWVLRLGPAGEELGGWTWGGAGTQRGFGIAALEDGGCVITGMTGEGHGETDGFVVRLDGAGREIWKHMVTGPGFHVAYHVRPARDGGVIATGYGFAGEARDHDAFVLRLDASGRMRGRTDLGGPGYDRATQSVEMADGSLMTVGYTRAAGAAADAPAWRTVLYGLGPDGRNRWTLPFGGEGGESGRWIAGSAPDLWVVSQVSPPGGGSRVQVARFAACEDPARD